MKQLTLIFLATTFIAASLQCNLSFASKDCTQGPDCEQLNAAIKQIKDAKNKRHQDVHQYGKDSAQVKNDDLVLTQATQKDHELRADRKSAEQSTNHHHSQRHSSGHGKHNSQPHQKTPEGPSHINLTQF